MTVTAPDNIEFGTVTGRFIYDVNDSADPDTEPDFKALQGTVTFVASVNKVIDPDATPVPVIIGRVPIVCVLDSQGYLCAAKEDLTILQRDVELIATDDADLNPIGWTWIVSYNLKDQNGKTLRGFDPHPIAVLAGQTRDLSTALPADSATAVGVAQAEALAAQAAADAAQAQSDAATAAAAAAAAAASLADLDPTAAALVGTPGTDLEEAVAAKIRPHLTRWVVQGQNSPGLLIYPTFAAAAAAAVNGDQIVLAAGDHTVSSSVTMNALSGLVITGQGIRATRIVVSADVVALNFTGCSYPVLRDLTVRCTTTARTVFPVKFTDCTRAEVDDCYFDAIADARHSGVHMGGVGGVASMGAIKGSVFNHSCVLVEVDDVKISNSWIWGQTNDYCVAVRDGSASVVLTDVDVVPPYNTTATGIAAIVVGDDGSNPFNFKVNGLYLDGNPQLHVKAGIHLFNGVGGVLLANIHANQMDHEPIIIDGAYNVLIDGYTSYANNQQGNGSPEILVRKTGAQPVENVRIRNVQFLQTTAGAGTRGPAIKVESTVSGSQVTIDGFDVKRPTSGGGYTSPVIDVPVSGGYPTVSMSGRDSVSSYSAVGSQAVASGATNTTITLGAPNAMAYRARPGQIMLATEGATLPNHRIQYTSDNQIFVAFATAIAAAATIHWRVDLRL